jgi:hypothetical protein
MTGKSAQWSSRIGRITSDTGMSASAPSLPCTEDDPPASSKVVPRAASVADRGIRVAIMPLDTVKQGLVTYAIQVAREKDVAAYVGDGLNCWPAAHRLDTAHLYRLALEKAVAGARYQAVAEEGLPTREIAEVIGRSVNASSPLHRKRALDMLAGSRRSWDGISRLPARKRGKSWDGTPQGPDLSPISRTCSTSQSEN